MLLESKVAAIYGASGAIGVAVARAFAHERARVLLAGRIREKLDEGAKVLLAEDGVAETVIVDALDEQAVDRFVDGVVRQTGHIV